MTARPIVALLVCSRIAHAQDAPEPPPPEPAPEPAQPAPEPGPSIDDVLDTQDALAKQLAKQQRQLDELKKEQQDHKWLSRFITVFVDVGAFAVGGDGSGIRSDYDHLYYPRYANTISGQWVFLGDPLSTTINSLGEPADTSDSREIKADTVNSGGRPSLIVNSLGLSIGKEVGHDVAVAALAELLPRPDHDILDIELANVQWHPPIDGGDLLITAGKMDSVLGVEYRNQDAFKRLGITPSLICRYTCGRPLGVQARYIQGGMRNRLSLSAALTDGDNFDQRFEHDYALKANRLPTASGHVEWLLPTDASLELGVSGAVGPQDGQPDLGIPQWHFGIDVRVRDVAGVDVTAEYVQGIQAGRTMSVTPCDVAACLSYKGAYVLVDRRVNSHFTPYVRMDWRDARHQNGVEFAYESHTLRGTVGVHAEVTSRIIGKLEYTWNRELGNIPQFADDIITSSIVVATD